MTGSVYCDLMPFEIISEIRNKEVIAKGSSIREIMRLVNQYGQGQSRALLPLGSKMEISAKPIFIGMKPTESENAK